jgi:hypothetical protein
MGYCSDVRIATTKEGYDKLKELVEAITAKRALAEGYAYNLLESTDEKKYNPKADYVIFGWDYIKWYEDNDPDVNAVITALKKVSEKYPVRFIRVGEEPGDIEDWDTDPQYVLPGLYTATYIDTAGRDEGEEINLDTEDFINSLSDQKEADAS